MSPETDANDHVPLEFLLGARMKYYYPEPSTAGRATKAKRVFASSIHPRKREERARELLRRVLDHEDSREIDGPPISAISQSNSDRSGVLKSLEEAASASLGDREAIFDPDSFHLSFEGSERNSTRIKSLQQLRDDDLRRQQQRDASFHGYEEGRTTFLDVTGAAARIPHTTTRQLRDLKLSGVKAKKKSEDKRTQELTELLHEQQAHTRAALRQQQQLSKTLLQQKLPRVMSTSVLSLDSIDRSVVDGRRAVRTIAPLNDQDFYYDQQRLEEQEHPGRPIMATLNLDLLALSSSPTSDAVHADSHGFSSNNEDDGDVESEQIRKRLVDRQREAFTSNAANGLFLGGGYIARNTKDKCEKKTKSKSNSNNPNNRFSQAASNHEVLEAVLGTQSASILPLAEANPRALRRRKASAGHHRPKHQIHTLRPDNE